MIQKADKNEFIFKNRKLMRNYHQGELILQLYDNRRIDFIIKRMDYNLYVVMQ